MSWLSRMSNVFRAADVDRTLDEETAFHIESRIDELTAAGMTREAAHAQARRQFGNRLRVRESSRDVKLLPWVETVWHDLKYGARSLRRTPGFSAAAVLSLALGIGANTAMFNLIDSVLLRMLPVTRPEELVVLGAREPGGPAGYRFSFHMFEALQQQGRVFVNVAASAPLRVSVEKDGRVYSNAAAQLVSGNYFDMLGVGAVSGRALVPADDDGPDAAAVAVLGHGYWQRQFGGDPGAIGQVIRLNGEPFTIVGVSPPEFFGTRVGEGVDITVPLRMQPRIDTQFGQSLVTGTGADDFWLELLARLGPGVSAVQAQAQLDPIFQRTRPLTPQRANPGRPARPRFLDLEPGGRGLSPLRERFSAPFLVLMGIVGAVLLIACANVANLLLARAANRRGEIAVRAALGAGRARLVRQLLVESVLLAMLGGGLGLLLAFATRASLAGLIVDGDAGALDLPLTMTVLAFTAIASVATVLVFGIVPAFAGSRVGTFTSLREGARQVSPGARFGLRSALVITQVALSVVLLVGAGLFVRTLMNLRQVDLGFEPTRVLVARLEPRGSNQRGPNEPRLRQLYADLLARVRALPGVEEASLSGKTPLGNENPVTPLIAIPGYAPAADEEMRVRMTQVYPGYFRVLGVPLLAGRDVLASDDTAGAPPVAVINAEMARRFFFNPANAVGRRFVTAQKLSFEIVGVVANSRDSSLRDAMPAVAFSTYAHTPTGRGQMTLYVRTAVAPAALISSIREFVRVMDPTMPLPQISTVAERVSAATRQEALVALLSVAFGTLALVLAVVGLYGLMSYTVARRRQEFGLRVALGASPGGLQGLIIRESLVLVAIGLTAGFAVTAVTVKKVAPLLFALDPLDPAVMAGAAVVLLVCAVLAAYIPARQVTHLVPVAALRDS